MRLQCHFTVLSNLSQSGPNNGLMGTVSIGKDKKTRDCCLQLCSPKNKSGLSFNVKMNVAKLFDRFVEEGKLTIRLKQPAKDVQLSKADPIQLKAFIKVLNAARVGATLPAGFASPLAPAKTKHFQKAVTELVCEQRHDYPFAKGFPKTLERLVAVNCRLNKLEHRVVHNLTSLHTLDLSNNCLSEEKCENFDFSSLKNLKSLDLSSNGLKMLMSIFWTSLPVGLLSLNLADNALTTLSDILCRQLRMLSYLNVSGNYIAQLPFEMGRLDRLRHLDVSNNQLKFLPSSLTWRKLDSLHLPHFEMWDQSTTQNNGRPPRHEVCSLADYAGKAILDSNQPLSTLPRHLISDLLYRFPACTVCRKACLPCVTRRHPHVRPREYRLLAQTVCQDQGGDRKTVPLAGYLCSERCELDFSKGRL